MDRPHVFPRASGPPGPSPADMRVAANDPSPRERAARIVRTIEADIIPRLVRLHSAHGGESPAPESAAADEPAEDDVHRLVRLVLQDSETALHDAIGRLRERGVSIESIYLRLLAPAARELGRMWAADDCLFSDVTVGVGRLHRLMRGLSPEFARDRDALGANTAPRVLLVVAPGEQHTFGLAMVAEFFRRARWEVIGGYHDPQFDPAACLRRERIDVLGVTCSVGARLEILKSWIVELRKSSCNQALGILVGGSIFGDQSIEPGEVGADATAADGPGAVAAAGRILAFGMQRQA